MYMWGILNLVVQKNIWITTIWQDCLKQEIKERNCPEFSQEVSVKGDDEALNKWLHKLLTNYNGNKCFIGDQQPFL